MLKGYTKTLRGAGVFFFLVSLTALSSMVIVFPLWYFSTQAKSGYTMFVALLTAAAIITLIILKIRRAVHESRNFFKEKFIPGLFTVITVIFFLIFLYGILWLFSKEAYFMAILAVSAFIIYILFLGFLKYGRKVREKTNYNNKSR